jgi:uncharacterized oligopeptide transporter (OPT) family protein
MATLIKGILSFNLDWQFVFVGVALAVVMELCGVNSLSFAVGAYLPLSTTLPIFCGGVIRGFVDWRKKRRGEIAAEDDSGKRKFICNRPRCRRGISWCDRRVADCRKLIILRLNLKQ